MKRFKGDFRIWGVTILVLVFSVFYGFLVKFALEVEEPSSASPIVLYSNQGLADFRLGLKQGFAKAQATIDIWTYAITDPMFLKQLRKKADEGVHVALRFDRRGGTTSIDSSLHPEAVKGRGLMHRKIVVLDKAKVFLGSANMTASSLQLHGNFSVGLYHEGVAEFLTSSDEGSYAFQLGSIEGLIWLLPDPEALKRVERAIDSAEASIFIAMFTLTEPSLVQALVRAHHRGVLVTVALDRYTAEGASQKAASQLLQAGVKVIVSSGLPLLHHKWGYIDQKALILGSTNWTKAAFQKNRDVLLFLTHLTSSLRRQVEKVMHAICVESSEFMACWGTSQECY